MSRCMWGPRDRGWTLRCRRGSRGGRVSWAPSRRGWGCPPGSRWCPPPSRGGSWRRWRWRTGGGPTLAQPGKENKLYVGTLSHTFGKTLIFTAKRSINCLVRGSFHWYMLSSIAKIPKIRKRNFQQFYFGEFYPKKSLIEFYKHI